MLVGAEKPYAFLQKCILLESQMDRFLGQCPVSILAFLFYMSDVRSGKFLNIHEQEMEWCTVGLNR